MEEKCNLTKRDPKSKSRFQTVDKKQFRKNWFQKINLASKINYRFEKNNKW